METPNLNSQTSKKVFDFHKVFAAIGIILIAMVIICGGVWYYVQSAEDKAGTVDENTVIKTATSPAKTSTKSAEKDETADWLIYSNSTLGFSIKYPKDWIFENQINNQGVSFKKNYNGENGRVVSGQIIDILRQSNPTKKSINNWWQKDTATDYLVSDEESFKVDNHEALKYKVQSSSSFYGTLVDNKEIIYVIDLGAVQNLQKDTLEVFNLMISTFKFL